jgi:hypothetical protein
VARDCSVRSPDEGSSGIPFRSTEEAWFWSLRAQGAGGEGGGRAAGADEVPRPCEPIDLMRVVDRLYRQRRLARDHLLVLAHYGRRSRGCCRIPGDGRHGGSRPRIAA